jgi:hypothetical protein
MDISLGDVETDETSFVMFKVPRYHILLLQDHVTVEAAKSPAISRTGTNLQPCCNA